MAIEIAALSSAQIVVAGREVLGAIGRLGGAERLTRSPTGLPGALTAEGGGRAVALNVGEAATLLAKSVAAGKGIVGALEILQGSLNVATQGALVSSLAGVVVDGNTRVSGLNIQAAAGRVVDAIADLVKASEFAGANLISSTGRPVSVQTTAFGGSIRVSPQALDPAGLGIADLAALNPRDARASESRVAAAIAVARARLGNLLSLQEAVGFSSRVGQAVSGLLNGTAASLLPRGSLVNFVA